MSSNYTIIWEMRDKRTAHNKSRFDSAPTPPDEPVKEDLRKHCSQKNGDGRPVLRYVSQIRSGYLRSGKWALFPKADLRGVCFYKSNLRGTDFSETDLRGAIFYRTDLAGANFRGAKLDGAVFYKSNLYAAWFEDANLSKASLYCSNLERAVFWKANLSY